MSNAHATAAASRTLLPPSPEHTKSEYDYAQILSDTGMMDVPPESTHPPHATTVESTTSTLSISRLHSIARFPKFQPTALACSAPLSSNHTSSNSNSHVNLTSLEGTNNRASSAHLSSESLQRQQQQHHHNSSSSWTSLGALAGSKGVAIFNVAAPHTPLMVLRHTLGPPPRGSGSYNHTNPMNRHHNINNPPAISSMAFQSGNNNHSSSLSLAAARGNGILVWDCSGHSISPLVARMGIGGTSAHTDDTIVSLAWYHNDSSTTHSSGGETRTTNNSAASPFVLAGATGSSAFLWDLRQPPQQSSNNSSNIGNTALPSLSKPSLRFGGTTSNMTTPGNNKGHNKYQHSTSSQYVQLACSTQSHDCALLDSLGTVRLFDLRKAGGDALLQFRAHDRLGIGLAYLPTSSSNVSPARWVTWGLDSLLEDPVVRIWEQRPPEEATVMPPSLTGSLDHEATNDDTTSTPPRMLQHDQEEFAVGYNMLVECEVPNLCKKNQRNLLGRRRTIPDYSFKLFFRFRSSLSFGGRW